MSSPKESQRGVASALAAIWWIGVPLAFRRVSASLFAYSIDGVWIFSIPALAALATPVAAAFGLLVGTFTLGYTEAPFESIALLAVVVVLGTLSSHLGLAFVTAFCLGDFFLSGRAWTTQRPPDSFLIPEPGGPFADGLIGALARERVPLLIGYALLAAVTVGVPPLIKGLLAQLRVRESWPLPIQVGLSVMGHAALTYFLVNLWAEATPVLIRPMWIWEVDQTYTRDLALSIVEPLQTNGSLVMVAATMASVGRMAVQWRLVLDRDRGSRISALQERLRGGRGMPRPPGRVRKLGKVVWRSLLGTLLLAGMIATPAEALVLASVLLVAGLVQTRVIPVPLGSWPAQAARIPMLFRFLLGLFFVRVLLEPLTRGLVDPSAETFRSFLTASVLVMLVFMILLPAPPDERDAA